LIIFVCSLSFSRQFVQENCRRAAVLSNKVMKHGFVKEMESILDSDTKISHRELSEKVSEKRFFVCLIS